MPVFSKMMASYPMQFIRGLGPNARAGLTAGAVGGALYGGLSTRYRDRETVAGMGARRLGRGLGYGALGGGAALGVAAMSGMNFSGISGGVGTFARNMMRPGNARAYGSSVMAAGKSAFASAAARVGKMF